MPDWTLLIGELINRAGELRRAPCKSIDPFSEIVIRSRRNDARAKRSFLDSRHDPGTFRSFVLPRLAQPMVVVAAARARHDEYTIQLPPYFLSLFGHRQEVRETADNVASPRQEDFTPR